MIIIISKIVFIWLMKCVVMTIRCEVLGVDEKISQNGFQRDRIGWCGLDSFGSG